MLSTFACLLALHQAPIQQPPRLRTILGNGAIILVDRVPDSPNVSLQLFVSSRAVPDTKTNHGLRHLLEHFEARGRNKNIDAKVETAGGFLYAKTTRVATQYEVVLPKKSWKMGVDVIQEIMQLGDVRSEDIQHEVKIMRQEGAIRDVSAHLADAAWSAAYGEAGLDPFGDLGVMGAATPELLTQVYKKSMVGSNVLMVISGDVDLDEGTQSARSILASLPRGNSPERPPKIGRGGLTAAVGLGEARGAIVGDMEDPLTIATVAAGLGVASEVDGSFMIYTPTKAQGMVVIGRVGETTGVGAEFEKVDPAVIFDRGRSLARRWVRGQIRDASGSGNFRGQLMIQSPSFKPERFLDMLDRMSFEDFKEGLARFREPNCVTVTGR